MIRITIDISIREKAEFFFFENNFLTIRKKKDLKDIETYYHETKLVKEQVMRFSI